VTNLRAAALAGRDRLRAAGIEDPEIEAELLLRFALEAGNRILPAELYTRFDETLTNDAQGRYESYLSRRLAHEPSAYITGRKEFCGLEFLVTPAVLIPRPETETLVEAAIKATKAGPPGTRMRIADVGTGSGAIAVSLAKALSWAEVYATDVSREALSVAAENARRHGVERRIAIRAGYLLTPLHDYVDLIVANLPYVTTHDWTELPPELREREPRLALDGGADGLDLIRVLLRQAPRYLNRGGAVLLEIGEGQAAALGRFVEASVAGASWRVE
jgi:release factor glutamine methyltransferase